MIESPFLPGRAYPKKVAVWKCEVFRSHSSYRRLVGWWDSRLWLRNVLHQKRSGLDLQLERTSGPHGRPWRAGNQVVGFQYQQVRFQRFNPALYLQWFNGYGELLVDYDRYVNKLRGGVSWFY